MTCNESDAALEIQSEILRLEQDFEDLGEDFYTIAMKRKMIRHRIDDLKYKLRVMNNNEPNNGINTPN